jgi:predicted  nucleic acid-binding Zn-ribbon protein
MVSVNKIQEIKTKLDKVKEDRIRAEERYKQSKAALKKLGYNDVEEAEQAVADLQGRIDNLSETLEESYEEFMDEYGELFE